MKQSDSAPDAIDKSGVDILKARALEVAKPLDAVCRPANTLSVVEFRLASERYAVEHEFVVEVHPLQTLTPLPCTPPFIVGIISIRGKLLPVIDIKKFFELPEEGITDIHLVIVVQADDVAIGILADTIVGTTTIDAGTIQPTLPTLTWIRVEDVLGVGTNHLVILDARKMMADPKLVINEEVHAPT